MARNSLKNVCKLINSANRKLPPEEDFLNDLKRSMEMTESKNKRKPSQTYKPSGMQCMRAMYYQVAGVEPDDGDTNYTLIGICNSGTDIHDRTQKAVMAMKDNGIDCEYTDVAEYVKSRNLDYLDIISKNGNETKLFHKDLNMSFLCDGIVRYKGRYFILELKTESIYKWQSRTGVDPKHYNQGTAYSLAFGIEDVIFVYISRDILDMKSYMFHVTDEMRQALKDKIDECNGYVERKIAPPKPENITNKICAYCGYKNTCKKEL